ncbi:hypothetical protein [Pseudorhizobium flavum]|uniref:hypothetical protein n=1 Tax=Pseudorhizobium flavum TaxID=1335061 RepID=UPI001588931B|nr:hypothetical protein [Pseudorhizobium flavum]
MSQLHPIRALRETVEGISPAVRAAREYRHAGAVRRGDARPANAATAYIPL